VGARKDEIRRFFAEYITAMTAAIESDDGDVEKLAELFAVPSTLVTGETYIYLSTPDAVRLLLRTYVDRLRAKGFDMSVPTQSDLRLLNDKSCLLEVHWVRPDDSGTAPWDLRLLYMIADTGLGWRVVSLVVMGYPPNEALLNPDPADDAGVTAERSMNRGV
jgi:hypothetical protein